jgi:hypothetical protein
MFLVFRYISWMLCIQLLVYESSPWERPKYKPVWVTPCETTTQGVEVPDRAYSGRPPPMSGTCKLLGILLKLSHLQNSRWGTG